MSRAPARGRRGMAYADAATQTDARGFDGVLDERAVALANPRADATRDAVVVSDVDGVGAFGFTRALAIPSRALAALTRNADHAAAHRRVAVAARRLDVAAEHHARLASSADHLDDAWRRARRRAETCALTRPILVLLAQRLDANARARGRILRLLEAEERALAGAARRLRAFANADAWTADELERESDAMTKRRASTDPDASRRAMAGERRPSAGEARDRNGRRRSAGERAARELRRVANARRLAARVGSEIARRAEAALAGEPFENGPPAARLVAPEDGMTPTSETSDGASDAEEEDEGANESEERHRDRKRRKVPMPIARVPMSSTGVPNDGVPTRGVPTRGVPTRARGSSASPRRSLRPSVAATVAESPSRGDEEGVPSGETSAPSAPSAPMLDLPSNHTPGCRSQSSPTPTAPSPERSGDSGYAAEPDVAARLGGGRTETQSQPWSTQDARD